MLPQLEPGLSLLRLILYGEGVGPWQYQERQAGKHASLNRFVRDS